MRIVSAFLLLFIVSSCTNRSADKNTIDSSSADVTDTIEAIPPAPVDKSEFYIWNVNSDQKTKTRNPQLRPEYYNVDNLITGLNEKYPRILLQKKGIGHDTLYTVIKDAQYLTEQMGSTGAEQYVAQVVLNLTAVKEINYVRIDFEEGSHASPDVWSREQFADYKEVK